MITPDKLVLLTNMPACMLAMAAEQAGYKGPEFTTQRFLGITNGGQFCYSVGWVDPVLGQQATKVFLTYNPVADRITADYDLLTTR